MRGLHEWHGFVFIGVDQQNWRRLGDDVHNRRNLGQSGFLALCSMSGPSSARTCSFGGAAADEVQHFFDDVAGVKYSAALLTCCGAGPRISEAVTEAVRH